MKPSLTVQITRYEIIRQLYQTLHFNVQITRYKIIRQLYETFTHCTDNSS